MASKRRTVMFDELDTVVLAHDIDEYFLKRDDVGVIVHCYKNNTAYEVEFVTGDGQTVALITLKPEDIRLMGHREILSVRALPLAA